MYHQPSSCSSNSHVSMGSTRNNNLTRYGSAPISFLSAALDPSSPPATSDSTKHTSNYTEHHKQNRSNGLGLGQMADYKSNGGGNLIRQSSSPAGFFLNQMNGSSSNTSATPAAENVPGIPGPRSSNSKGGIMRLSSQLSFTRQDSMLSHISEEESENGGVDASNNGHVRKGANSYGNNNYQMSSWPNDPSNAIIFSSSSKRAKNINRDVIHRLNREESQLHFGLNQSALEMAAMENLMHHIPEDSVPCKIRAKRGCATHPRSIAERERRTRISGKLKKLQDLVPNMDKQTSYADMLDLAVQHIKGLQNQVQKLNSELEDCTCGCNRTST